MSRMGLEAGLAEGDEKRYFLGCVKSADYVNALMAQGRFCFSTAEAVAALGSGLSAVRASLRRLERKGALASPFRGFHVIVPPEYRRLGCLPAEQFIPQLMAHLGIDYYVALLSAAELHGAAHQRPQGLQVMVARSRRPIVCGSVRVHFVARQELARTPVVLRNTPRGALRVASAEATALEIVGHAELCGGLDNVATVLAELELDPAKLVAAAAACPVVWVQRLGYLLDRVERGALAEPLVPHVEAHAPASAPLVRASPTAGAPRSERWRLILNADVEPDL